MHLWLQEKAFVQSFKDECSHFWCTWVEVEVERWFDKSDRWSHCLQDAILVRILRGRNNQIDTNKIELAKTKFPPSFLKESAAQKMPPQGPGVTLARTRAQFGSSSLVHFWAIFVLKLIPNTLPRCEKTSRRIHILWQSLRNVKFDRHLCKWHSIKITTTTTTTFLCWRSACELYQISWLKWPHGQYEDCGERVQCKLVAKDKIVKQAA